jgi:hypothetical protein
MRRQNNCGLKRMAKKKKKFDATEIFYEYDRMLDRLARLHSFGNSLPSSDSELSERAERLAKDDLLNFSIHCRRLLTIAGQIKLASKAKVLSTKFVQGAHPANMMVEREPSTDIWKIINTIMHHDFLKVINSSFDVDLYIFNKGREALGSPLTPLRPVVILKSDKVSFLGFKIATFVDLFCEEVLEDLVDALSEGGVYVEMDMREL